VLTLTSGNVRFWSPGERAEFPLFASPFVQFFYPLNLPLALYYRVAGGYSVVDPTDRGGGNYAYSTEYEFTFSDTVGSLAFPPAAQAEGW
jgi:hypothetical protein